MSGANRLEGTKISLRVVALARRARISMVFKGRMLVRAFRNVEYIPTMIYPERVIGPVCRFDPFL
ncbi:hypothetical protein VN12_07755 [Pirellula sp. SH-Sr6A]|nr:hypothetical protein VN12_07755 [Pirellula sp. SH-Sr6A]